MPQGQGSQSSGTHGRLLPGKSDTWGRAVALPRWRFLALPIAKRGNGSAGMGENILWLATEMRTASESEDLSSSCNRCHLDRQRNWDQRGANEDTESHRMCLRSKAGEEPQKPVKKRSKTWQDSDWVHRWTERKERNCQDDGDHYTLRKS